MVINCKMHHVDLFTESMEPLLNRKPDPQDVTAAHRGENDSRSGSSQAHCICVLLVSGMLVMIGSGITHSYGVILVELIDKEGVPPTQASWATGIQMVLFYSSGYYIRFMFTKAPYYLTIFIYKYDT